MEKDLVSVYTPPISSAYIPTHSITLEEVWERITSKDLQEKTQRLRALRSEGKEEEYKSLKKGSLPSVTFGGTFDYRRIDPQEYREYLLRELEREKDPIKVSKMKRTIGLLEGKVGLLESSGFVIIDIDHISETGLSLQELKDRISEDRELGVRLVFTSPSGDGLKVVCRVSSHITDKDSYKTAYNSLRHFINSKYGEIVDKSGSDIDRLCLLCCDRDARIRDYEETFSPDLHPVPQRERPVRDYQYTYSGEDGIEEIVRRVEESGLDIAPDYADFLKLGYMFANEVGGQRGLDLYTRVCRVHTNRGGYSITEEEIRNQYNKCKGGYSDKGVFINIAKRMGIDVTKPVELPQRESVSQIKKESPIKESTKTPTDQDLESKWESYLSIPSLADIASKKREGIKTDYRFESRGKGKTKEEYLTLRSGAMTLICGKSSHCKSKLLQNLALNIATKTYNKGEEGDILFFTYEEELSDVLSQFANIFADIPGLSQFKTPNTEVILDYFKTGDLSKCTKDKRTEVTPKLGGFRTLYESGRLRVYYSDLCTEDLCSLIEYLSTKIKIKAVFVDYVQLLYMSPERKRERKIGERREELKEICNELRTLAINLSIPVVSSAQLNRETPNPTDMSEDNLADSADLTRYANTIVCLWNSYFDNVKGGKENYNQAEEGKRLQSRGFVLGEGGKLYARITKNRGGTPYLDTILNFKGETGRIDTNEDLPEEEEKSPSLGFKEI